METINNNDINIFGNYRIVDYSYNKYGILYNDDYHERIIAFLEYDEVLQYFDLHSVGLKYLEYADDKVDQWILKWCETMSYIMINKEV